MKRWLAWSCLVSFGCSLGHRVGPGGDAEDGTGAESTSASGSASQGSADGSTTASSSSADADGGDWPNDDDDDGSMVPSADLGGDPGCGSDPGPAQGSGCGDGEAKPGEFCYAQTYAYCERAEGVAALLVFAAETGAPDRIAATRYYDDFVSWPPGAAGVLEDPVSMALSGGTRVYGSDLDLDGIQDILVPNTFQTLSVLMGTGDGQFMGQKLIATGQGSQLGAVARLDDDMFPDFVVFGWEWQEATTVVLMEGTGDGSFEIAGSMGVEPGLRDGTVGDLDGDGFDDVVIVTGDAQAVRIGLSDGAFGLSAWDTFKAGAYYPDVRVADIDVDGNADILLLTDNGVDVHLGAGDGTFGAAISTPVDYGTRVFIHDLDLDGEPDIIVTSEVVQVFSGDGAGSFAFEASFTLDPQPHYHVEVGTGELNDDGMPDIVVLEPFGNGSNGHLYILESRP